MKARGVFMSRIFVIGGGASGLVAALMMAEKHDVTLLEKNKQVGKKILLTGNGKCNYWNLDQKESHYHSNSDKNLNCILNLKDQVIPFFESIGIIPKIKDGYYYPMSGQAVSIQVSLLKEALVRGVNIMEEEVIDVCKKNKEFEITTNKGKYKADKVIIATGGLAAPKTGSTGFGYEIAKKFGHHIVPPLPALVQLHGDQSYFKDWHGIRIDALVSLCENGKIVKKEVGEVQLTSKGISGICVFQLSRDVSRGLTLGKEEKVFINFLHTLSIQNEKEFILFMNKRDIQMKERTISELLDGFLPYRLGNLILKLCHISKDQLWKNLSQEQKLYFGKMLTFFEVKITEVNSFDYAQTTNGGVSLNEIDLHTMESLKEKGLYFIGEVLDVDGDCGGYNLGFAWMSGMKVALHINNFLEK